MIDLKTLHLHWRVSHYKGHSYRSYSLARSYRHKGTNRKDIVLKLGKLSDEEAGRWRELLQAAKTPQTFFTTLNDLRVTNHYAYCRLSNNFSRLTYKFSLAFEPLKAENKPVPTHIFSEQQAAPFSHNQGCVNSPFHLDSRKFLV